MFQLIRSVWSRRGWVGCAAFAAIMLHVGGSTVRGALPEENAKAALVYHLTQFITWPETGRDVFRIGILGPDPFGTALDEVVYGERVGQRRIEIRRSNLASRLSDCDLVYISPRSRERPSTALPAFAGRRVLTVGESDGFLADGGMIQLVRTPERKIRLRIHLEHVRSRDLHVSAQLLRVSEVLGGPGK